MKQLFKINHQQVSSFGGGTPGFETRFDVITSNTPCCEPIGFPFKDVDEDILAECRYRLRHAKPSRKWEDDQLARLLAGEVVDVGHHYQIREI